VDAQSGLVHSVSGTAANVADIAQAHVLLHGLEKQVYADAGYLGVEKREEIATGSPDVEWQVTAKRGQVKAMAEGWLKALAVRLERVKAQMRARVEHPFHILKNPVRLRKTRYRGLARTPPNCIAFSPCQPLHCPAPVAQPRHGVSEHPERRKLPAITSHPPPASLRLALLRSHS
jgi:IS5 family transposase